MSEDLNMKQPMEEALVGLMVVPQGHGLSLPVEILHGSSLTNVTNAGFIAFHFIVIRSHD